MTTQLTLSQLAQTVQMTVKPGEAKLDWDKRDEWQQNANDFRITLVYQGRRYSFDYWQGVGIDHEPRACDVLESLLAVEVEEGEAFADWCREFGYDDDSRKALRTFKACQRQTRRVRKLLGNDYESFANADRC